MSDDLTPYDIGPACFPSGRPFRNLIPMASGGLSYGDAAAAAVRAESEAARAEIRAAGIACPSCEVNLADLPPGHELVLSGGFGGTAQCCGGRVVDLASAAPQELESALTVTVAKAADVAMMRAVVGEPGTEPAFTGLLGTLGQA